MDAHAARATGTLGPGFRVGHHTHRAGRTGCTVILPPPGNVASCDIRGSAPGSRELAMLDPDRRLSEVSALLLTGGSAFGLSAADGVVAFLEERGIGHATSAGVVPIVPAAVVYDLAIGRADARPGPAEGRAACEAAVGSGAERGSVGAGTGASVGTWAGRARAAEGGVGFGHAAAEGLEVRALAVANCVGNVLAVDGSVLAGTDPGRAPGAWPPREPPPEPSNTVLAVLSVHGPLDKPAVRWLAARGSDGITISVRPAHTRYDGDVVFAVAAPSSAESPPANLDVLGPLATEAVAAAVRDGVTPQRLPT